MEVLSEHQCQGWLEGYLLTGRHGFFSCYEAFVHIVDSMFNQHAKWLKVCNDIPWRAPVASLNYLLSSHVWRQDHNGFSHQDPGFLDHVVNKKAEVIRVYLPPDANCLLSVTDHCLRSRNYVNVVVAGKQPAPVWLTMDEATRHCAAGVSIWEWASNDRGRAAAEPDVVLGCCGDVPTLETLAAADFIRRELPELKVRVINVVDLMKLQPPRDHPHGMPDADFDALFTQRSSGRLRVPRLPDADPQAHVQAQQPRQLARARLQGRGHDHHALRHVRAATRSTASTSSATVIDLLPALGARAAYVQAGAARQAARAPRLHPRARRRHARGARLEVAGRARRQARQARGRYVGGQPVSVRIGMAAARRRWLAGTVALALAAVGGLAPRGARRARRRKPPAEMRFVARSRARRLRDGGDRRRSAKPGVYAVHTRLPANITIVPHTHGEKWRIATVLSGTLYYAQGDDVRRVEAARAAARAA